MESALKTPQEVTGLKRTSMDIHIVLHRATKQLAANTDKEMNVTYLEAIECVLSEKGYPADQDLTDERPISERQFIKPPTDKKDIKHIAPVIPKGLYKQLKHMAAVRCCTCGYLFSLGLCRVLRDEAKQRHITLSSELEGELYRYLSMRQAS